MVFKPSVMSSSTFITLVVILTIGAVVASIIGSLMWVARTKGEEHELPELSTNTSPSAAYTEAKIAAEQPRPPYPLQMAGNFYSYDHR